MAKLKDRYAIALFEISEEANTLEMDLDHAIWIRDSLDCDDIKVFLVDPGIPKLAKTQVLQNTFSDKVSKHMMGFLQLIVQKNRESLIVPSLTEYIELVNRHFGRIKARVVSATPPTENQMKSINNVLSKKTDMKVEINTIIDPDVIGGFYILVDGRIFDNTVRTQLNNMKKCFYKGSVVARVVSAKPLTQEQISFISDLITRKINTNVEISAAVDPDLIGGFYVVVDGHFYDGTVRTQLKDMKKSLKRGNLEW